ncbi:MAG: hypothetical protein US49_C0001G0013 [candidate division TM6 bacterium GW2011_GWF2_37_49]|nr:MAG: hypothetical protein US49_C0001G0013 [candidate division TM6 bacterium GW2011_GWF2_37_49]
MKITKILSFLIVAIISSQSLFCATQSPEIPTKLNILTIIEKQVNKDIIKYDADKDEVTIFIDKDAAVASIKMVAIIFAGIGACAVAGGWMGKNIGLDAGARIMIGGIGAAFFLVGTWLMLSVRNVTKKASLETLKFTSDGLKKYTDFVMAWQDVAQSEKTTIIDELVTRRGRQIKALPDASRTKVVIRYKTKNNSRLFDLDESNDPFCAVSSKDLQELINYYVAKYGNTQAAQA